MRYLILFFLLLPLFAKAQIVGKDDLSQKPEIKYIRVRITSIPNLKKKGGYEHSLVVDSGLEPNGLVYKDGERYVPQTEIEAVNYIASFGWDAISESYFPTTIGLCWTVLMKRK